MASSIIDGTVEAVNPRQGGKVLDSIAFRLNDGSSRTLTKTLVKPNVAEALRPGASGRFYLYTAVDHKGIHGVRDSTGKAEYGFTDTSEKGLLVLAAINLVWILVSTAVQGELPLFSVFLLIFCGVGSWLMRNVRIEAKRQFDADEGYRPQAAATDVAPSVTGA